jgi:HAMP domain-containing protein
VLDLREDIMAIWTTLKRELDKAGQAAQGALDEGKVRLESHRAKQKAEAAAASLGFAIYRARAAGGELEQERYDVLAANLASAETEVGRLEAEIRRMRESGEMPAAEPE